MRFHLPLLIALSSVVHVGVIANTSLTARDSLGFARQAVNLAHPERAGWGGRIELLRNTQQPPGYPLAILAVDGVLSCLRAAPRAEQLLLAAQAASGLAGVLIVLPLYGLARKVISPGMAFGAVAVYTLLPAVARYTSDGLSESCFLLACVSALYAASSAMESNRWWAWLLGGLSAGLAYLVRPEGLAVAAAILIAMLFHVPRVQKRHAIGFFLLGVMLPALPYMAMIGGISNKPVAQDLFEAANAAHLPGVALLAEFRPTDATATSLSRWVWCAKAAGIEYLRATHYAVGILAFLALVRSGRTILRSHAAWAVMLLYAGLQCSLALALAHRHGYVSDRHLLPVVPVAVLLAFRLLDGFPSCRILAAAVIAATCVAPLFKSLHENRVGHKHAGRYLAGVLTPEDQLTDPFEWEGFYSGRTIEREAVAVLNPKAIYAVLDDAREEGAHPRLRHMPEAVQVSRDPRSELVFAWPPGAGAADAKVRVYKLTLKP